MQTNQAPLPDGYRPISMGDMHAAGKIADKELARAREAGGDTFYSWTFYYTRAIEKMVADRVLKLPTEE